MTIRKEFLAAYEYFALKEPSSGEAHAFLPGMPLKAEKTRPEQPPTPASKPVREPITGGNTFISALASRELVEKPQAQQDAMKDLLEISEILTRERDAWRAMAERLTLHQTPKNPAIQEGKRLEALRRFLARELHPDKAKLANKDRALLQDLFQRLWPQIDRIAKGQATA